MAEPLGSTSETLDYNVQMHWAKKDTIWMLSLFGTAIGAGVLFLPINAGSSGLLPLLIISTLAYPMTHYAHRGLARFVLSGSNPKYNLTDVAKEHFGDNAGLMVSFLYFFSIFPIQLMYSVALTNTVNSFWIHQLGFEPLPRALIAGVLLFGLMSVVRVGQGMVVRVMSTMVYPFVIFLLLLSFLLIPHWNVAFWNEAMLVVEPGKSYGATLLASLWFLIPLMVFSFNHSPIISSFATIQRHEYGRDADRKCRQILKRSHLMMMVMVLFFVYSCVFSLTPEDLKIARQENISILSYLANHFQTPIIAYAAPLVAFVAISKSFLGHYLGAREGLIGMWNSSSLTPAEGVAPSFGKVDWAMCVVCWVIATINPSILGMIECLGGPIVAILLFIMPVYAMYRVPALKKFQYLPRDIFVGAIGLIAFSTQVYALF